LYIHVCFTEMKTKIPEVMKSLQNTSHIPPKNQRKQRHKMNPPPKKNTHTFFFTISRIFAECSPSLQKLKSKQSSIWSKTPTLTAQFKWFETPNSMQFGIDPLTP
jgi:hypothetical protein